MFRAARPLARTRTLSTARASRPVARYNSAQAGQAQAQVPGPQGPLNSNGRDLLMALAAGMALATASISMLEVRSASVTASEALEAEEGVLGGAAQDVEAAAQAAKEKVQESAAQAKETVQGHAAEAKEKVQESAAHAKEVAGEAVDKARENLHELIASAEAALAKYTK